MNDKLLFFIVCIALLTLICFQSIINVIASSLAITFIIIFSPAGLILALFLMICYALGPAKTKNNYDNY